MIWSIFSGGEPGLSVELDEFLGSSPDSLEEVIYIAESWKYMDLEDRDAGEHSFSAVQIQEISTWPISLEKMTWKYDVCMYNGYDKSQCLVVW